MLKKLLQLSFRGEEAPKAEVQTGSVALVALAGECERAPEPAPKPPAPPVAPAAPVTTVGPVRTISFEQIYQTAASRPPRVEYGILKVAEMVASPHISTMSPDAKRSCLLMALEAAGIEIEDVLQDAVLRQRALNDFEEAEQLRLREWEKVKTEENAEIQAELDRVTAQYMSRIQANLDELAEQQDTFRAWQKRKQTEAQRITEAAAFCVPPGSAVNGAGLTAVLERATGTRR